MYYLRWLVCLPFVWLVTFLCWWTNPIACLFVYKAPRTDKVKRLGKQVVTLDREYLKGWWYLWQTHDNAVDEGWYGAYDILLLRGKTQEDYDKSKLIRYFCRWWWLKRNTAYGWSYKLFSVPLDKGWQINKKIPLAFGYANHINIGWKSHKGMPKKLFAGRVFKLVKLEE